LRPRLFDPLGIGSSFTENGHSCMPSATAPGWIEREAVVLYDVGITKIEMRSHSSLDPPTRANG
jgi:hypothetical protein